LAVFFFWADASRKIRVRRDRKRIRVFIFSEFNLDEKQSAKLKKIRRIKSDK
jgi:hypothetical protein